MSNGTSLSGNGEEQYSSIAILLPRSTASRGSERDGNPDEDDFLASYPAQGTALVQYLENRILLRTKALNNYDWEALCYSRDVSPSFEAYADSGAGPLTWNELVDLRKANAELFPGRHIRVIFMRTQINATADHGLVFVLLEVYHPHRRQRGEKMMVYEFTKMRGLWLHSRHTSIRAPFKLEWLSEAAE